MCNCQMFTLYSSHCMWMCNCQILTSVWPSHTAVQEVTRHVEIPSVVMCVPVLRALCTTGGPEIVKVGVQKVCTMKVCTPCSVYNKTKIASIANLVFIEQLSNKLGFTTKQCTQQNSVHNKTVCTTKQCTQQNSVHNKTV